MSAEHEKIRELLHAYVDGELDLANTREAELLYARIHRHDDRLHGLFVFASGKAGGKVAEHGAPVLAGWSRRRGPRAGDGHEIDFVEIPYDPAPADREAEIVRLTAACTARNRSVNCTGSSRRSSRAICPSGTPAIITRKATIRNTRVVCRFRCIIPLP